MFRLRRAGPRGFHTTRHVVRMRRHTRVPRPSATVQLVFHNAMLRSCPLSDDGLLKHAARKAPLWEPPHCVFLFLRSIVLRLRGGFGLPCESEEGAGVIFFYSFLLFRAVRRMRQSHQGLARAKMRLFLLFSFVFVWAGAKVLIPIRDELEDGHL